MTWLARQPQVDPQQIVVAGCSFVRRWATVLGYEVLARADLGRDAASLFDPTRRVDAAWVEPLRRAYLAAPGRLLIQAIPLLAEEHESLRDTTLRVARAQPKGGRVAARALNRSGRSPRRRARSARSPSPEVAERLRSLAREIELAGPGPVVAGRAKEPHLHEPCRSRYVLCLGSQRRPRGMGIRAPLRGSKRESTGSSLHPIACDMTSLGLDHEPTN